MRDSYLASVENMLTPDILAWKADTKVYKNVDFTLALSAHERGKVIEQEELTYVIRY